MCGPKEFFWSEGVLGACYGGHFALAKMGMLTLEKATFVGILRSNPWHDGAIFCSQHFLYRGIFRRTFRDASYVIRTLFWDLPAKRANWSFLTSFSPKCPFPLMDGTSWRWWQHSGNTYRFFSKSGSCKRKLFLRCCLLHRRDVFTPSTSINPINCLRNLFFFFNTVFWGEDEFLSSYLVLSHSSLDDQTPMVGKRHGGANREPVQSWCCRDDCRLYVSFVTKRTGRCRKRVVGGLYA